MQERFQPLGVGCLGGKPLPALCKEQGKKPQQCPLDLQLVAGELGAVGILHLPQAGGGLQIAQIVRGQPRRQRQAPALQRKQIFLGTKVLCAAQKLQLKNDIFVFHHGLAALVQDLVAEGAGVVGVERQTKNLEEIFLSLTNTQTGKEVG